MAGMVSVGIAVREGRASGDSTASAHDATGGPCASASGFHARAAFNASGLNATASNANRAARACAHTRIAHRRSVRRRSDLDSGLPRFQAHWSEIFERVGGVQLFDRGEGNRGGVILRGTAPKRGMDARSDATGVADAMGKRRTDHLPEHLGINDGEVGSGTKNDDSGHLRRRGGKVSTFHRFWAEGVVLKGVRLDHFRRVLKNEEGGE